MDNNEQLIEAGTSSTLDTDGFFSQAPEAQAAEVLNDIIRIANVNDIPISVEESHVELTPVEEELLAAAIESQNSEIPVNSPTLLVEDVTSRFSGASWYDKIRTKIILLAGLGGIGRF